MSLPDLTSAFQRRYPNPIVSVDSHTAGEPTRLVISGLPPIAGRTMHAKLEYFQDNLDHVRRILTHEPRGNSDILAAVVTEPVSQEAAFGLLYMDAKRYPYLCGHATIGAVTTMLDLGAITAGTPELDVVVDTPSGPMLARASCGRESVHSVSIEAVPSFVYRTDEQLHTKAGTLRVDTVCVGGFFVMVDIQQLDLSLRDIDELAPLGMHIIEAANRQLQVGHPTRPEVRSIDVVEFYAHDPNHPLSGESVVIYGQSHVDRSPCGTGTAAKLTLFDHLGHLPAGESYVNTSPTGTTFRARIARRTTVGPLPAVEVEITGSASITGWHEFVIDPNDPFPQGFLL